MLFPNLVIETQLYRDSLQGLPIAGLCLSNSNHSNNDHLLCKHYKSSIMDVYRSCRVCSFKLCVTWCSEIRGGSIVCPPKSLGGCGRQKLELTVPDCLSEARAGLSWAPMVLWRACRKLRNPNHNFKDFKVSNCSSWTEFFRGYVEGLIDAEARFKTLKLEDWPPAESFQDQLPRHFLEFHALHTSLYWSSNMSTRLPMISRKLDFGPKMSIYYGASEEQGSASLTMIHYDPSDMVNILMHTATISSISSSSVEGFAEPEGGAIWDIFRRRDILKLEEYLRKYSRN